MWHPNHAKWCCIVKHHRRRLDGVGPLGFDSFISVEWRRGAFIARPQVNLSLGVTKGNIVASARSGQRGHVRLDVQLLVLTCCAAIWIDDLKRPLLRYDDNPASGQDAGKRWCSRERDWCHWSKFARIVDTNQWVRKWSALHVCPTPCA